MSGVGRVRDQQEEEESVSGVQVQEMPQIRNAEGGGAAGQGEGWTAEVQAESGQPVSGPGRHCPETHAASKRFVFLYIPIYNIKTLFFSLIQP